MWLKKTVAEPRQLGGNVFRSLFSVHQLCVIWTELSGICLSDRHQHERNLHSFAFKAQASKLSVPTGRAWRAEGGTGLLPGFLSCFAHPHFLLRSGGFLPSPEPAGSNPSGSSLSALLSLLHRSLKPPQIQTKLGECPSAARRVILRCPGTRTCLLCILVALRVWRVSIQQSVCTCDMPGAVPGSRNRQKLCACEAGTSDGHQPAACERVFTPLT